MAEINFYAAYPEFRKYDAPDIKSKHVRQFDEEFWVPGGCSQDMSILEIGCGGGLFLAYLENKGVSDFAGIDTDEKILDVLPGSIKPRVEIVDVWQYLNALDASRKFDRVAMFDVLEHFTPEEGVRLLQQIRSHLTPDGKIIVRVPNMASPWGLQYQYHDLTHKAAYSPGSIQQLSLVAGMTCTKALAQKRRKGIARLKESLLNFLLSTFLTESPGIWSANFVAVIENPKST